MTCVTHSSLGQIFLSHILHTEVIKRFFLTSSTQRRGRKEDESSRRIGTAPCVAGKGPRQSYTPVDLPSGGGQGGGRERGSGDRRWRDIGEAASVRCGEVMATPRRMGVGLLGQQE